VKNQKRLYASKGNFIFVLKQKQGKTTKGNFIFVLKQAPKSNYMQKKIYTSKNNLQKQKQILISDIFLCN
jgi:hypothetical protein